MAKRMRVFLPSWVRWVLLPVLLLVWGLVTYSTFFTAEGRAELGLVGWLLVTAILLVIGVMVWLMASGRLPAYIIEAEDRDSES